MEKFAKLIIDGREITLPLIAGSEGERAIDIRALRQQTGLIPLIPGMGIPVPVGVPSPIWMEKRYSAVSWGSH